MNDLSELEIEELKIKLLQDLSQRKSLLQDKSEGKTDIILEKIKQKTKELVLFSTSHGLPHAFRTNRIFFKIMWISLFIMSTSLGIRLQKLMLLQKYQLIFQLLH